MSFKMNDALLEKEATGCEHCFYVCFHLILDPLLRIIWFSSSTGEGLLN